MPADVIFVSLLTSLELQIVLAANTLATGAPGSRVFLSMQLAVNVLHARHPLMQRPIVKATSARNVSVGRKN